MVRFVVAAAVFALLGCSQEAPQVSAPAETGSAAQAAEAVDPALAQDGRDIAEAQCAACHAVGPYGDSPAAGAPPFRTLLSQYRADVLEAELINGIRVAHPMPEFQFNPQGVDALIAYLQSIQQPLATE
jgi:mono/diheme cytochrome c family protein